MAHKTKVKLISCNLFAGEKFDSHFIRLRQELRITMTVTEICLSIYCIYSKKNQNENNETNVCTSLDFAYN